MRFVVALLAAVAFLAVAAVQADRVPGARVELRVVPTEATVGDALSATLDVWLPSDVDLQTDLLGPRIGPFTVAGESWAGPEEAEEGRHWSWTGSLVSFRTGDLELPPIRLTVTDAAGGASVMTSDPQAIAIASVLGEQEDTEIADLKGPASLPPDYRALWVAAGILLVLLAVTGLAWWLQRRYADRLTAVELPDDPFRRTPPHVWVYAELQKLLDRRLSGQDRVDLFFAELSWILKRYLTGRYRVELMERTTPEVAESLEQAGAPGASISEIVRVLRHCDRVKFAREMPSADACKRAIEEAYEIVDATKPRSEAEPVEEGAA